MALEPYDQTQIEALLNELNSEGKVWLLEDGKLTRHYVFEDFKLAFAFMAMSAITAEKMNHHPEWFNVYNKVKVQLVTHEISAISVKDADLARKMDMHANKLNN